MSNVIMGIDPSLRGLAMAMQGPEVALQLERWSSDVADPTVHMRCQRYRVLMRELLGKVHVYRPGLVVIEGYAFSRHGAGGNDLIEFGGILREHVTRQCARVLELQPSQLKLFATGDGRADKRSIARELQQRYGRTFDSHDEADAFVCMQVGLCLVDQREPGTWFEREVIAKLQGRPVAKRTKGTHRNQRELTA